MKKVVLLIILGLVTYSLPAQDADTHIASLINNEEWFTLAEDLPQYSDSIQADHQTRVSPNAGGTLAVFLFLFHTPHFLLKRTCSVSFFGYLCTCYPKAVFLRLKIWSFAQI